MFRLSRLAVAALIALIAAGEARAQPPVWVVYGPHATLVLFGSVHLLPRGLDWEPPQVKQAIQNASDVWFEVPMDEAAMRAAATLAQARGAAPLGQTLDSRLSKAGRDRLARLVIADHLVPERLQVFRPWWAEIVISLASYELDGAQADEGVEHQLSAALPSTTERQAFETPSEQIEALAGSSDADQVASLEQTLKELEAGDKAYQKLIKAWMAGDVIRLKREALDPIIKASPGVYRTLVVARNQRWMAAIRARLNGSGEALMVVGVGHLIGPDSLPAMLRAEGYEVEGP